jgi:CheY-like chemotaxis protein
MLVDIGLPVMDGYELATRVREAATDSTPRLIALTGYGRDIDRSRTRDAGFEDHLVKPVAGIDLLAAVAGRPSAQSGVPRA